MGLDTTCEDRRSRAWFPSRTTCFFGQDSGTPTPPEVLGVTDDGNITQDPLYDDAARRDYLLLSAGSPLPEGGAPLAHTTSAGSGRQIPLDDAYWAFDGFGFHDEEGDLIQVGTERVRVVQADWQGGVLTVDRDISWTNGAPVSLAWEGTALAIGCYEQGNGLEHVGILPSSGLIATGEPARFEFVGVPDDARVVWNFGDGVRATGRVVDHAYAQRGRYAVRVHVQGGPSRQRAAMAMVVSDRSTTDPLVNLDFSRDDDIMEIKTDTWTRPLPDISRVNTPRGSGLRIQVTGNKQADEDGGIESRYYPLDGWNVDEYPYLVISYNIDPQVSLHFGMDAFSVTGSVEKRRMDSNNVTLTNDGQWHELAIDVREIRDAYPDVTYLAGVIFYSNKYRTVGLGYTFQTFCISSTTSCP